MAVFAGSFTAGAAGELVISSVPFQPTSVELSASSKTSSSDSTVARLAIGYADASYQSADSILVNSVGYFSRKYRNEDVCLSILSTSGGSLSATVKLKFLEFTATGVKFDVINASSDFQITAVFRDS